MMRMPPMKWTRSLMAVIALLLLAAPQPLPAASTLSELRGIDELKSWFNASKGRPRLIFLLSPT